MDARNLSRILFRIVYSSSYTFFFIVLLILLCATPGDQIYQTVYNGKVGNIPVVGGTYFVTLIVALFIYASRLYSTRSALLAIPKPYLPIEEGELGKNVRKMIVKNRQRSALIAWESRPRDLSGEKRLAADGAPASPVRPKRKGRPGDTVIDYDPNAPPWGDISHPGWSSPLSEDFPDLHFDAVLAELPNLIEAKAVALAPADPAFDFLSPDYSQAPPPRDPQVVALLQRQSSQTLRDYVLFLSGIKLINADIAANFVARYEYARFSTVPLEEIDFRGLMTVFSELLVGMDVLDIKALDESKSEVSSSAASVSALSVSSIIHQPLASRRRPSSSGASLQSSSSVIHHSPTSASPG